MNKLLLLLSVAVVGCSTVQPDTSPSAITSGDVSLVQAACSPVPTKGLDICRFHSGDPVTTQWKIYLPWGDGALSGEVRIKWGDQTQVYQAHGSEVDLNFSELFGSEWASSSSGLIQALATVKYSDKIVQSLGYALIVILAPGYDPLPMSSYGALVYKTCSITYTSAGRSSVNCQ